jgi:hypothetical protein
MTSRVSASFAARLLPFPAPSLTSTTSAPATAPRQAALQSRASPDCGTAALHTTRIDVVGRQLANCGGCRVAGCGREKSTTRGGGRVLRIMLGDDGRLG